MKCCQNDDSKNSVKAEHKHSGLRHLGMMLLCCLIPLGLAVGFKLMGYSGIASYLMILLCPLMHLFMMKDMVKVKQSSDEQPSEGKNS